MKRLTIMLVAIACLISAGISFADKIEWRTIPIVIRTNRDASGVDGVNRGFIDSTWVYLGAVTSSDTSETFVLKDQYLTADSLTNIHIWVSSVTPLAFSSGESLYVTLDGSASGQAWTALGLATCGTCMTGSFAGAMSLVPGTTLSASKLINAKGSSTAVGVASGSGVIGLNNIYGNFWQWPALRLRIRTPTATAPVVNQVRYWITYQAVKSPTADN